MVERVRFNIRDRSGAPGADSLCNTRHSDMGSLTLLFRQPVAALQVLTNEGTWKWVRPQTDALTVNIADALQFLTSTHPPRLTHASRRLLTPPADGYLKSSIHRVVAPPRDQAHINRLGVIYMVRIEDDTELVPIRESPVLQRRGLADGGRAGRRREACQGRGMGPGADHQEPGQHELGGRRQRCQRPRGHQGR